MMRSQSHLLKITLFLGLESSLWIEIEIEVWEGTRLMRLEAHQGGLRKLIS